MMNDSKIDYNKIFSDRTKKLTIDEATEIVNVTSAYKKKLGEDLKKEKK